MSIVSILTSCMLRYDDLKMKFFDLSVWSFLRSPENRTSLVTYVEVDVQLKRDTRLDAIESVIISSKLVTSAVNHCRFLHDVLVKPGFHHLASNNNSLFPF